MGFHISLGECIMRTPFSFLGKSYIELGSTAPGLQTLDASGFGALRRGESW